MIFPPVFRALFDNLSQKSSMFELYKSSRPQIEAKNSFFSDNRSKYWFLYQRGGGKYF